MEIVEKKIEELKPWEKNPRINDHAVDAVAKSISAFGFNVPILCDQNLLIVAGHTRWKAAKQLGLPSVPVIVIEMTDEKRKAFAIADNKTAEIADWDFPTLRELLDELRSEDFSLEDIGFTDAELRRLFHEDDDADSNTPGLDVDRRVSIGDCWLLGRHRLLCGDSCDPKNYQFLLNNEKIDLVFGGPPYFNLREYSQWKNFEDYIADMQKIIGNCFNQMTNGGVLVWNVSSLSSEGRDLIGHHSLSLEKTGFRFLDTIIWRKSGANFSVLRNAHITKNRLYYPTFGWEALLVYQKQGPMPKMTREGADYMAEYQVNVWEITSVRDKIKTFGHPDSCPVELPYRSMQAYSGQNGIVFEPFGGSGTTLIAAEKAGRRAVVIEKNPHYCDIIIHRWERQTNGKAVLKKGNGVAVTSMLPTSELPALLPLNLKKQPSLPENYNPICPEHFSVEKIILAKGSLATPERETFVRRICAVFPDVPIIEQLDKPHNRIPVESAEIVRRNKSGKKILVFGTLKESVRYSDESNNSCPNFWHFSPTAFCFYDCKYCYLAGTLSAWYTPAMKIYVNLEEILTRIDKVAHRLAKETAFYIGKLQDGLSLDPLTAYSTVLVPFFATHPFARQTILTKSGQVDRLLSLPHNSHTSVTWSLLPAGIASRYEADAPSVEDRIAAMKKCFEAGYPVRAMMMPLLPMEGWQRQYSEFVQHLLLEVPLQRLTMGGICSFQNARYFMENKLGKGNEVSTAMDVKNVCRDGRFRYPASLRIEMYRHIIETARQIRPDLELALCLEDMDVWKATGLEANLGRCNCVL